MKILGCLCAAMFLVGCVGPPPSAPRVIGVIVGVGPDDAKPRIDALRKGLESFGYREGREVTLDVRFLAGGNADRAAQLTDELIRKGAVIIVTGNTAAVDGARLATSTVPIVLAGAGTDPVATGWVSSLARPGGNLTGLSLQVPTLPGRRLQMLKEMTKATHIGLLQDATAPGNARTDVESAARALGIDLEVIVAKDTAEIDEALAAFRSRGITSVHVNVGSVFPVNLARITKAASAERVATSFGFTEGARAGGLFTLGPEQTDLYRRAATYVHKILKGANPGDLPVEQPERVELIINLKTAQAIGITIPDSILAQATELIR